jgi:hypothetical protein
MTGLPPSEVAADHVRPTMPAVVTTALLAKDRGAVGATAFKIEISFEKLVLKPKAFLDLTLNLKRVLGVRLYVVVKNAVVMPDANTA